MIIRMFKGTSTTELNRTSLNFPIPLDLLNFFYKIKLFSFLIIFLHLIKIFLQYYNLKQYIDIYFISLLLTVGLWVVAVLQLRDYQIRLQIWMKFCILTRSPGDLDFPGGSDIKRLPAMRETWVQFLGREDPLEKGMAIHSSTFAWKIPWTEEPGRATVHGAAKSRTRLNDFSLSLQLIYMNHNL